MLFFNKELTLSLMRNIKKNKVSKVSRICPKLPGFTVLKFYLKTGPNFTCMILRPSRIRPGSSISTLVKK